MSDKLYGGYSAEQLRELEAQSNAAQCVSDAGGCDGDLVGLEHEPHCPASKYPHDIHRQYARAATSAIPALLREREELLAEREAAIRDVCHCFWCAELFPYPKRGTSEEQATALTAHTMNCPKHPMHRVVDAEARAERAEQAERWIPVSEKLPEFANLVEIFMPKNLTQKRALASRHHNGGPSENYEWYWWYECGYTSVGKSRVTHWRPLPPSPGKE